MALVVTNTYLNFVVSEKGEPLEWKTYKKGQEVDPADVPEAQLKSFLEKGAIIDTSKPAAEQPGGPATPPASPQKPAAALISQQGSQDKGTTDPDKK